jgi:hypothetical protein
MPLEAEVCFIVLWEVSETVTLILLLLDIFIFSMPCQLGLFLSSILPFVYPWCILQNGPFFYFLRSLSWTVCASFDKGGTTDPEHIWANTKS